MILALLKPDTRSWVILPDLFVCLFVSFNVNKLGTLKKPTKDLNQGVAWVCRLIQSIRFINIAKVNVTT